LAFWKKEVLFLGLVLALGMLLVGVTGPNWKYTWLGGLDNWSYVGYGKHYTDCEYRAGLYKSCRVPWIWWEAAVRNLFPGEPGSRAVCFSLLFTWGAGWYLFARQMGSVWVAAGLSLFAVLYVPSHGSGGWDYHNGASGVFWVLALAQAVWIRNRATGRPGAWLLLGGWLGLAVHTNIILLNTAPLFLVLLWPEFRRKDGPGFVRGIGWILAGFVGLTFVLGAINVAIGRRPFFYWKILQTAFVFVEDTSHNKPLYEPLGAPWTLRAHYLALPAAAALFSVVSFFRRSAAPTRIFCGFHLFLTALWIYWHMKGVTALNIDYIAYPLVLSSLPVVWVALRGAEERPSPGWVWLPGAGLAGIGLLAAGGWRAGGEPPGPLLLQTTLFVLGLLAAWSLKPRWAGVGLLLLLSANAGTPAAAAYGRQAPSPNLPEAHARILELQDWAWPLRNERPRPPRPSLALVLSGRSFQTDPLARLVWDPDDPTPHFIPFVVALGATDFEMSFPAARQRRLAAGTATREDFAEMQPGMCLFVADTGRGFAEKVAAVLRGLGIPFRRGEVRTVSLDWGTVRLEQFVFL